LPAGVNDIAAIISWSSLLILLASYWLAIFEFHAISSLQAAVISIDSHCHFRHSHFAEPFSRLIFSRPLMMPTRLRQAFATPLADILRHISAPPPPATPH
jgi:hydrogenase-4 membrane subunit HyfE